MTIYSDIQAEIIEAYVYDLVGVVKYIDIITQGDNIYDPDTGVTNSTQVSYPTRALKLENLNGEKIDLPTQTDFVEYFVLDSDMEFTDIDVALKIIDDDGEYKISGIERDPAKASYIITGRRLA